jgi:hypothetical protein
MGVRWVGDDSRLVFRQKLLGEDGSVRRGVVMVKQPGLFSPKFGATSSHETKCWYLSTKSHDVEFQKNISLYIHCRQGPIPHSKFLLHRRSKGLHLQVNKLTRFRQASGHEASGEV